MGKKPAVEVKVGDAFGHWVVVGEDKADRFGRQRFKVQGTCGAMRTMERYALTVATSPQCSGCRKGFGKQKVA